MAKKQRKNKKRFRRKALPLGGFPDRKIAKLKYCDFVTLNATALGSGVPTIHHFRANSLFDPDHTGTGHQPRGFDEHAAIYDHYTVIGSKLKVTFESDVDNIATVGQYCFTMLQDTSSTPGSLSDIMEGGHGKTKVNFRPRSTAGGKSVTLTSTYSPHRMFGIPKKDSIISVDSLTPTIGSNPVEDAIYTIGVFCQRTTTTDPPPVIARVEIEYIAIFTEKRPIVQS